MTVDALRHYRAVWAVNFEFTALPGHRPTPLCVVARELRSGRLVKRLLDGSDPGPPPYATDDETLFVSYYASDAWGCHLALGWPMPRRVLDLFAEFANLTAGARPVAGREMYGALVHHGLPALDVLANACARQSAERTGQQTSTKREELLNYAQRDVDALAQLLPAMLPRIDFDRALLRGRYTVAVARMEWHGVPLDGPMLRRLQGNWTVLRRQIAARINERYGVFEPCSCQFSAARWGEYLAREGIPWPRHESGVLALDDDTFRELARVYPNQVGTIRDLRHALDQLQLNKLAVGPDGRNRVVLSMFASKTGRNQPSSAEFIFGPSCWLRSLIRPAPGRALAYCDWSAQELGIAAALSGDRRMQEAYTSGDPYLWFGKFAGWVPPTATKSTHSADRDRFKVVMLGVLYGLSETGLARKLGTTPAHGRELMCLHRKTFRTFWQWSDAVQDEATLTGTLRTPFGWTSRFGPDSTPTSMRNFPMQANGAEMMRLAACLATERGIEVCCPIHDAFLIEADSQGITSETERMKAAMQHASECVLPGFPLRTDAKLVQYPDRYLDERGRLMWETVNEIVAEIDPLEPVADCGRYPDQSETGTCIRVLHPVPYSSSFYSSIPL